MVNCPYCGKLTDPKLENCPHCGGYLMKGLASLAPPKKSDRLPHQNCPNCHALVKEGDIICVACGTNLLTGQRIAAESRQREPILSRRTVYIAGGAVFAILAAAAIVVGITYLARDPVQRAIQATVAGNLHEASNILSEHLQDHPDDARAQFVLGKVLWKMNQFRAAAEAFEKASERDPTNLDAAMLAVLGLSMGGGEGVRERQVARLRKVTAKFPDNQDAWYLLALLLGDTNDLEGQLEALNHAGKTEPAVHQARGIALALKGDGAGAETELLAASREMGEGGDMAAALGLAACLAGKGDVAAQHLRHALDTGTSEPRIVSTRLALLLIEQGNYEEAERYLAQVSAEDRNNPTAQFYHAVCLQARGQSAEALREFEAVAQQSNPYTGAATIRAAEMQLAQGNTAGARDLIEKAMAGGAASAELLTLSGRAYVQTNEDSRAREAFDRALSTDPAYAPAYLERGLLYVKQQMFTDGIADLEKYVSLMPPDVPDARVDQIQTLLDQLRQATGRSGEPAAATAAGRNVS